MDMYNTAVHVVHVAYCRQGPGLSIRDSAAPREKSGSDQAILSGSLW